jgi:hypothetical protein
MRLRRYFELGVAAATALVVAAIIALGLTSPARAAAVNLWGIDPANGNAPCIIGVVGTPTTCALPGSSASSTSGSPTISAPFTQTNPTVTLPATTSTARVNVSPNSGLTALVYNTGAVTVYVAAGGSGVTASTTSTPVPPGSVYALTLGSSTYVAGITASGSATLLVTPGTSATDQLNANLVGATPAGTNIIGKVGIDQTTPGTTNGVGQSGTWTVQPGNTANTTPWLTTETPGTSGGLSVYTVEPAASDNHANIKNGAGQVYGINAFNNSSTINYIRLYNAGSGFNGCNSATNLVWSGHIGGYASADSGFILPIPGGGIAFSTGISICIVSAYGQNTTTNATASAMDVNVLYK